VHKTLCHQIGVDVIGSFLKIVSLYVLCHNRRVRSI